MLDTVERTLIALENGGITRRQAVGRIAALLAAAVGGGAAAATDKPDSLFRSRGLNHIALAVTNLERSRDFYGKHLGLTVLRESSRNCFMAAGTNNFVALFKRDEPGMDHYCYTVEGYSADDAVERLRSAGLRPRRTENRVYFDDPDGLTVQVASEWGDYPG